MPITYRDLRTLEELRQVVALEKAVWGYADAEDVVPVPLLVVTVKRGGILVGAFDEPGRLVGFVYSIPALKQGRVIQWSHMLGVLETHRQQGIGLALKLEQRRRALGMDIDLVEWTFDPLQATNAHLNFARLGVIAEEYLENLYGESSSHLHRGTPTDRLIVQWWIRTPRVARRTEGTGAVPPLDRLNPVAANTTRLTGSWRECGQVDLELDAPAILVEIPTGFTELQLRAPELALAWRLATRRLFRTYLGRGYRVVEFYLDRAAGCGRYLLSRTSVGD
jgi:predicted GNAT superfamily acetyltransferase